MKQRLLTLAVLLLSLTVAAQQPSQQATKTTPQELPKFVSTSEVVVIPVVVTDKSGKPVRGLAKSDFTVVEGDKPRTLASFEELQNSAIPLKPPQGTAPDTYQNFVASSDKPQRLTIIVLDMVNTPFISQARVRSELLKHLLTGLRADEPTALFAISSSGVKQIHAFTTDPRVLIAALRKVTGKVDRSESVTNDILSMQDYQEEVQNLQDFNDRAQGFMAQYAQREAIRATLQAMEQIANAFAGLPGRKSMLWATSGFPFLIDDPLSLSGFGTDMVQDYERTWRILNTANIAVYPVDAEGVSNPTFASFDVSRRNAPRMAGGPRTLSNIYQRKRDTLYSFANATGGRTCLDRNDLADCFEQSTRDSDTYYMLSYQLPANERTPGWHKLKVQVARKGVEVRARSGFFIGDQKQATPDSLKLQLGTALASPLDYTGIPLNVQWMGKPTAPKEPQDKDKKLATFRIATPAHTLTVDADNSNHLSLQVVAMVFNGKNKPVSEFWKTVDAKLRPEHATQVRDSGFFYQDELALPKGQYTVKFLIRDDLNGKIGSVSAPIEVN